MTRVRNKDLMDRRDIVAHPELLAGRLFTEERCPDCGGTLTIDLDAMKGDQAGHLEPARIVACDSCEFIREIA